MGMESPLAREMRRITVTGRQHSWLLHLTNPSPHFLRNNVPSLLKFEQTGRSEAKERILLSKYRLMTFINPRAISCWPARQPIRQTSQCYITIISFPVLGLSQPSTTTSSVAPAVQEMTRSRNTLQHKSSSTFLGRGAITTAGENTDRRQVAKSDTELCLCTHPPSSIHRIPADVLCTIFETYCQVELYVTIPLLREFLPPQFIVSQVCCAWRQIMLDTPLFWNKIRITFYYATSDDEMIELVEVSRMWLSRAKYLPCFIDFYFVPLTTFENDTLCLLWKHEINKNIVRDLIASHKFKSLGVTFADYHLHGLLRLSDKKLSCIEVLCLDRPEEDYYVHDVVPQLDFHRLSNLTSFSLNMAMSSLEISGRGCQYFQMFSGIPWHQLRHVHLGVELPALRCLNIL
ncbi:hypothetical protein M378DRAFT_387772 [Amanita muscaria Koide BX008]|uniref:Uncharacterized protein n=1 Tax=Amanita muscaria (strain Koide BX008) TaxID=946122 RepID=A0A0C2XAQ1_AMAMK|nr:hypothetical protein M378DRAFT_387772 [Amanita muscaria Koide BX008]